MDKNVTKEFLEGWHIQGTCNFEFAVGIYANKGIMGNYGELLGVITFGQHQRQGFADVSVLNRLCWKEGISVIGGAKRMLHHALKRYSQGKKIVTWSDNRWSAGGLYERLGFTLETEYGPDYFYTNKNNVVASKQSKQKKHLKALPHETEVVAARRQGWERIWDCGKKKWTLVIGKINLPHQKQFHES
jgi:GNAT superfamily N-acetyltransferase